MGELISKACAGGVQVILETHSDHLLNGIRLAVKKKVIDRNLIRLNYFYLTFFLTVEGIKPMHTKCSPAILEDGSLSDWPDGFFDEWEKAIDELF
jgi:predicted ATPase